MPLIYMTQTLWGLSVSHSITDLTACSIATDCHMQYETRDFIQTLAYIIIFILNDQPYNWKS